MKKKKYKHLSLTEREKISILRAQGKSIHEIGKALNRDPSTISRELQRNAPPVYKGYYLGHKAHIRAVKRKSQAHHRQRLKNNTIYHYAEAKLIYGWSPEQISGRISIDYPELSISHEAIYQYIYKEYPEWIQYLPKSHKKRHKRGHSRKHRSSHIPNRTSIDNRPPHIEKRVQAGHWESDTVVSRQSKVALLVLVERKSRCAIIKKLKQKTAQVTQRSIAERLLLLPHHLRRTITYDNGSENTDHETTNKLLGTQSYFCNPYHSWEKGTVENTIGLIRRFLPKKTDFARVDTSDIECIELLLNNRPRKCLDYLTPLEVVTKECCT